ncbi:MAG: sensor histidine kinase [Chloroflexota bacterium]
MNDTDNISANNASRLQRYMRLAEVCRALGRSANLEALLQTVVDAVCALTNSEFGAILMYEEETDLLKFVAGPRSRKETSRRLRVPLDRSLAGTVYSSAKPVVVQNASADSRLKQSIESPLGFEIRSMLAVPLIFRGETIGVLETFNKKGTEFDHDDVAVMETLAAQAAVATLSTVLMEETERAYDEVQELEKMKSNFIAIASHELRTPLGLVLGHATFLSDAISDPQQKKQMEVILSSAARLKCIIEDISNMETFQSGKSRIRQKAFDICQLTKRVTESFQQIARQKNIALTMLLPASAVTVNGDEEKLSVALGNIVANALSFTNEQGHITVSVETLPGYAKLSVVDDGIGIPTKDLSRVFERFYQVQSHLTRRHQGMGLGLSVAKAMVELHGGQIWVESTEGQGSDFSILLPAQGGEAGGQASKTPAFLPE